MMLYRPFLHFVSQKCQSENLDRRSYACAAACVSVTRNLVHIAIEMKRRGLLSGAQWFVVYTTYLAVVSLVYFVFENPSSNSAKDIMKDAAAGKNLLASLAKQSSVADRCHHSLAVRESDHARASTNDDRLCLLSCRPSYRSEKQRRDPPQLPVNAQQTRLPPQRYFRRPCHKGRLQIAPFVMGFRLGRPDRDAQIKTQYRPFREIRKHNPAHLSLLITGRRSLCRQSITVTTREGQNQQAIPSGRQSALHPASQT